MVPAPAPGRAEHARREFAHFQRILTTSLSHNERQLAREAIRRLHKELRQLEKFEQRADAAAA